MGSLHYVLKIAIITILATFLVIQTTALPIGEGGEGQISKRGIIEARCHRNKSCVIDPVTKKLITPKKANTSTSTPAPAPAPAPGA